MNPLRRLRRRYSTGRLLLGAVVAWIIVLTVLIVLDPRSAGGMP